MRSQELYTRAKQLIPGGVNSPVRAFKGVGGDPIFFKKGQGAYLIDVEDNEYIDYVGSWGPLILGHCHPAVLTAVENTMRQGMSFGAPTELEVELATLICTLMPSIEKIRMVNSGTEATMTAIRLARAYTRRSKIIKFNGCYHGHHDSLLVKAGSGLLTLGLPSTPGVPEEVTAHTLTAEFNHLEQVKAIFAKYPHEIAAIIVEPVPGNMGLILPDLEFLRGLKDLCETYESVLIFDEVMSGFRVALGGAQTLYNIKPDLTTLGKVIGGGMPVGALGGKAEIMNQLAPLGEVYQAGTLSGNPMAMAAGIATLQEISKPHFFEQLGERTQKLVKGLKDLAIQYNIDLWTGSVGGMFGFYFNNHSRMTHFQIVSESNQTLFKAFFHAMLKQGIYFAPSMYEAGFMSSAHTDDDIRTTLLAAQSVFEGMLTQFFP